MADEPVYFNELPQNTVIDRTKIIAIEKNDPTHEGAFINVALLNPAQSNISWFRKNGNDADDGLSIETATATLQGAATKAETNTPVPSAAVRKVLKCDDDGIYSENVNLTSYLDIDAESITYGGKIQVDFGAAITDHRIRIGATNGDFSFTNISSSTTPTYMYIKAAVSSNPALVNVVFTNHKILVLEAAEFDLGSHSWAIAGVDASKTFANALSNFNGNLSTSDTAVINLTVGGYFNGNINAEAGTVINVICWKRTGGSNTGAGTINVIEQSTNDMRNANSGWIDGGALSVNNPVTPSFNVAEETVVFKNYTDPLSPSSSAPITVPADIGIVSEHPDKSSVYVYLLPNLTREQEAAPVNWIRINSGQILDGVLVHNNAGQLVYASSQKRAVGDRAQIMQEELLQFLVPRNYSGNSVKPADGQVDKSIDIDPGIIKQLSADPVNNRTNPNIVVNTGATRPTLFLAWFHDDGEIRLETPSQQVDNTRYNPGGKGTALVNLLPSDFVAIPIISLFIGPASSSIPFAGMQFPTEKYSTMAEAVTNAQKFIRFDSVFARTNIIGYICTKSTVTNFSIVDPSLLRFVAGEKTPYDWGGGTGGGSAGGVSMKATNTIFVDDVNGSDSNTGLTATTPKKTLPAAYTTAKTIFGTLTDVNQAQVLGIGANQFVTPTTFAADTDYLHISCPFSDLQYTGTSGSGVTLAGNSNIIKMKRIYTTSSTGTLVSKTDNGITRIFAEEISNTEGRSISVTADYTLEGKIGYIEGDILIGVGGIPKLDIDRLNANILLNDEAKGYINIGVREAGTDTLAESLTVIQEKDKEFTRHFDAEAATYNPAERTNHRIITVNNTAGVGTVVLPTADINLGTKSIPRLWTVKDEYGSASGNPITISCQGGQLIDGQSNIVINTAYGSVTFYSDGTNLFTIRKLETSIPLLTVTTGLIAASAQIKTFVSNTRLNSFTVGDNERGAIVLLNNAGAQNATFPDGGLAIGSQGEFVSIGAGQWTFQSTGASSVVSLGGATKTNGQYSHVFWRKISSTQYMVSGDLTT